MMTGSEAYTEQCKALATQAIEKLEELSRLMKQSGDSVRAMDVDEAISYVTESVEEA
jgi:hypothetical protein